MARPEVLAFLADIKEHPGDRTPRLILADWLEERDDPRGTLLRAQVESSRLDLNSVRRLELGELEQRLIRTHQETWLGCLRSRVASWAFLRGLVQLQTTPDQLVREQSQEVIASEELAWVETIRLYGDTAQPRDYAATRSLQTARVLDASWARFQSGHLAGLAEAAPFPFLGELILNTGNLGPAGLGALGRSRSFPALRELRLSSCGIDDAAIGHLAGGSLLRQLHLLDLRNNRVSRAGVTALLTTAQMHQLRELNLMHNPLTDDLVPLLLASPMIQRLHVLDLRGNQLGEAAGQLRAALGPRLRLGP